jgi:hypothetical protein
MCQFKRLFKNKVEMITAEADKIETHSMRLGFAQKLVENGANEAAAMRHEDWESSVSLAYQNLRPKKIFLI